MIEIYRFILAYSQADTAFLVFKIKAALIYISNKRNGLGEIYMYSFIFRYFLIKLIGAIDRTVLYTCSATCAFALYYISGLFSQGYLEITCFSSYAVNFSIGEDLYIGMPADLDQFRCEYSHGAVIGGKGLVKLSHMSADGRRFINKVHLKTRNAEIKRGLNTADSSADNQNISEIAVRGIFANTVCKTFTNLVFNYFKFFFHFLSPHRVSWVP